jgi:two-component system, OmpR family, sensor histidine kinase QseC
MPDTNSIRRRLTKYLVSLMFLLTFFSDLSVYIGTTHEADELFDAGLVQTAKMLDGLLTLESLQSDGDQILNTSTGQSKSGRKHEYEKKLFLLITDSLEKTLIRSQYAPDVSLMPAQPGFSRATFKLKEWIVFRMQSSHKEVFIFVGERADIREEITEYIGNGMLGSFLISVPVAILVLWILLKRVFNPLKTVIQSVRRQDIRDLTPVVAEGVPDEVRPLVDSINGLMSRLNEAYQREKRFISDASHELRNPIASLLINVDNAIEEADNSELIQSLESMKRSVERLSNLISQLLELSHTDNPDTFGNFKSIDIGKLCLTVGDEYQLRAKASHQKLEISTPQSNYAIEGIESMLYSLIANLLDNAIKYSDSQGVIRLSCEMVSDGVQVSVDDSGSGLLVEMRERLTQRFYRGNQQAVSGTGLGLSIVESIVHQHQASLHIAESDLGGLSVQIKFKIFSQS